MCKTIAEGGQRCSAHTRPGYEAALVAWDANNGIINDKHNEKAILFATTKTGRIEMLATYQTVVATEGEESPKARWLHEALRRGEHRKEATLAKIATNKMTQQPDYVEPAKARLSLSPTRANDFQACPLAYRYKTIDKFPEPKTSAPVRGTLVHAVLEKLLDKTPNQRTLEAAQAMLPEEWDAMATDNPELLDLLDETGDTDWLEGANQLLKNYFHMEDPSSIAFGDREQPVEYRVSEDVVLRGFIDRLDKQAETGDLKIVDYKTGKSPKLGFDDKAMFQLRFYALAIWRTTGRIPKMLQLMYLGDGIVLRNSLTESDLLETEKKIRRISDKIEKCLDSGEFLPHKTKLCGYCPFKDKCPEFGGTIPPYPLKISAKPA